ncbi:MAG: Pyridoxal phosphate homeostasis protein [Verrucomicrobiae bacterium]|nr:Pyridoxal phosphate homeostasis protein [Verrucomicrobiae bacterium]
MNNLTATLETLRARIPDHVLLVGVTKTVPPEIVDQALAAGLTTFGENKIQEAKAKIPAVSSRARWHFIGHLQSNKARDAVALFDLIHSVDSVKLAGELNKHAAAAGKTQRILLEVNIAGEASKFGLKPEDVPAALDAINQLPRLQVEGLMTVAPLTGDARPHFRRLRELRDQLGLRELSMGMSHDFPVAIEEGATIVRIGSAIFGERKNRNEPTE